MVPKSAGAADVVDCDPGVLQIPLAVRFAAAVRGAAEDEQRRVVFGRLHGTVVIVVDDVWAQFTLRFDFGRLSVHLGIVGVPDITLRGPQAELESLLLLPFRTQWPVLLPVRLAELLVVHRVLTAWAKSSLRAYGALSHPGLLVNVLRVISAPDASALDPKT
ncbi:MAG: hypothetical protein SFV15_18255 [Polyangiaceae bacterium]|nr:hypothetical protein [Polyangiaceae bacterium]